MAIDWERVIVESDDNGVVVSAGQVSLLIGADADSVSWGNITGDITQQPDLMQIVDGYVSADSPTFTGTPRSVTPPEGNNSTRIATTAFVQGEMANVRRDVSGKVNEAPVNNHIWGRKDENWAQLGEMATVDEPAHGISSSEPQRFVRTKEPDGDMVWEQAGTMALLDAPGSLTPNITYGLYNDEWKNIDPEPNGSATKKYWLRTNEVIKEGEHTGDRDPKWEQAGTMALKDKIQAGDIEKPKDIYVDARNGNDETGTGGFDAPYKTIDRALQDTSDVFETTIMLESGTYDRPNPINISKQMYLYSLADGNNTVQLGRIVANNTQIRIYGNMTIEKITAINSRIDIDTNNGTISVGAIDADSKSEIVIDGNLTTTGIINASNSSIIDISGNVSGYIIEVDDCSNIMIDGSLTTTNRIRIYDLSAINVNGSLSTYSIDVYNGSKIMIDGILTTTGQVQASESSLINVRDNASVVSVEAAGDSKIIINGDLTTPNPINAYRSSLININGTLWVANNLSTLLSAESGSVINALDVSTAETVPGSAYVQIGTYAKATDGGIIFCDRAPGITYNNFSQISNVGIVNGKSDIPIDYETEVTNKPNLGSMATLNYPSASGDNYSPRYAMVNNGNPRWIEIEEPPLSSNPETMQECYVRTSYAIPYTDTEGILRYSYRYGWKKVNL